MIYKLYKTTYLDKYDKCYKNIITINKNPNDPLISNVLKQVSRQSYHHLKGLIVVLHNHLVLWHL